LLADEKIVHCDLKPDNILIDTRDKAENRPFNVKIIDFGSAYDWTGHGHIGMATPEYMPPEFLHAMFNNNGQGGTAEFLAQSSHPWSLDVWSLGAIILELITGIPLWLSLKCRVEVKGKDMVKTGLFAVKGRGYDKIYIKQKIVMETLDEHLAEYLDEFQDCQQLRDLIYQMMKTDPLQRISPTDILKHTYIASLAEEGGPSDQVRSETIHIFYNSHSLKLM
jgi:dual specificity tyrosine-phosphorylation-regulated kinase 2/3/4